MLYRALADAVLILHLVFIVYVVLGALAAMRWPKTAWLHIPVFLWGGAIEIGGWVCPLTYLENALRAEGGRSGYGTSFVEHYLLPVIYPGLLFSGDIPKSVFVALGIGVLALNGFIYWRIWRTRQRHAR